MWIKWETVSSLLLFDRDLTQKYIFYSLSFISKFCVCGCIYNFFFLISSYKFVLKPAVGSAPRESVKRTLQDPLALLWLKWTLVCRFRDSLQNLASHLNIVWEIRRKTQKMLSSFKSVPCVAVSAWVLFWPVAFIWVRIRGFVYLFLFFSHYIRTIKGLYRSRFPVLTAVCSDAMMKKCT